MAASGERITQINDSDVICGRRGVALKHPGNLAYRKIVGQNKELYATCPKNKKLRISKGIVYAMRDVLGGRFLEREDGKTSMSLDEKDEEGNPVAWRDIGEKKAIEKTSQALREGQPKLLKKLAMKRRDIRDAVPPPPPPPPSHPRRAATMDPAAQTGVETTSQALREGELEFLKQLAAKPRVGDVDAPPPSHRHQAAAMDLLAETSASLPYAPRQSVTPPPPPPPPPAAALSSALSQLLTNYTEDTLLSLDSRDKDTLLLALLMDRIKNGR